MNDPFPVSTSDVNKITEAIGANALYSIPQWGTIIDWYGRTILIFPKVDGTFAFTDISGGIPNINAPGGYIPAEFLKSNTPTVQTASWLVGMYSLPQNFLDVAIERFKQAIAAGKYIVGATGEIVAAGVNPLIQPIADLSAGLSELVWPLAIAGAAILYFMYAKKK
jgi:hypothetical protein